MPQICGIITLFGGLRAAPMYTNILFMTIDDIKHLKQLLELAKAQDPNFQIFGSSQHKYKLNPTLSETDLQNFEKKYGVALPCDYRLFLKEAGNGGAGPNYGLYCLEDTIEKARWECHVNKPFPFVEHTWTSGPDFMGEDWYDNYQGIIEISDQGCDGYTYLVVNGPTYGKTWTGYAGEFWPDDLTFGAWYLRWTNWIEERGLPDLQKTKI